MKTISNLSIKLILLASIFILTGFDAKDKPSENTEANSIIVLVKYKAQPHKGIEAVTALTKLVEKVKQEPHFVHLKLHVDLKDKTNILLYEEWDDESYYNTEHMSTDHLQKFIASSRNFLTGPPEISFWKIERELTK